MKGKIEFKPDLIVHHIVRNDKEHPTRLVGVNWFGVNNLGSTSIKLTSEEMKVIDDVLWGASRRKNLQNKQIK